MGAKCVVYNTPYHLKEKYILEKCLQKKATILWQRSFNTLIALAVIVKIGIIQYLHRRAAF